MDLTLIRSDLLLPIVGRAECSVQSLCAKINFLLIFNDNCCSFIGEYYGQIPRQSSLFQCFFSVNSSLNKSMCALIKRLPGPVFYHARPGSLLQFDYFAMFGTAAG